MRVQNLQSWVIRFTFLVVATICCSDVSLVAQSFQSVPALSFTKPFAGADPLPQVLTIAYTNNTTVRFTTAASTTTGGTWLSVSPVGNGCCFTPLAVQVKVTAGNLAAGSYTGQVVIANFSDANIKMTIPVKFTITAAGAAFFDDLPGKLSFSAVANGSPTPQTVQIRNGGAGTLNWTLAKSTASGGNWLTVSASSGKAPATVTIGITKANLPGGGATAGTFIGQLTFRTTGDSTTIPVAVTIGPSVITQVNPMYFTMPLAGANPLPQILNIATSNSAAMRYSVSVATAKGGAWLSITPAGSGCCFAPLANTVSINAATLAAGAYTGEIIITEFANPGRAMVVPVTLTILRAGAFFGDVPGQLSFAVRTNGSSTPQTFQVHNGGSGTLSWTLARSTADGGAWLTTTPSAGTAPATVSVGVNVSLLPGAGAVAGTFVGQIVLQTAGDTITIPVTVTVGPSVFGQVNPISFSMPFGGANPLPQVLDITSVDNSSIRFSASVATAKGGAWLSITPTGSGCCFVPLALTARVSATTLQAGTYTAEIIITEFASPGRSMIVPVNLTVLDSGAFFDSVPGQLSFSVKTGSTTSTPELFQVRNGGTGALDWALAATTADGGKWLKSSAASGAAPFTLTISVDPAQLPGGGLLTGTFVGELTLTSPLDISTIPVTVTVGNAVFDQANPMAFSMRFGGANPLPQIVTVAAADNSSIRFTTTTATAKGGNWLTVSPSGSGCCFSPLPLTASVNASTLAAGSYTGEIIITEFANPGRSMVIPVSLTVDSSGAFFDNTPGQMNFSMVAGGTASPQTLQLGNAGSGALNWTMNSTTADGAAWLVPNPLSGTNTPATVSVSIKPTLLPGTGKIVGTYVGQLLFQSANSTATVPVVVKVGNGTFAQVNPLSFVMPVGGPNPLPQLLSLSTTDNSSIRFSASTANGKGGPWLQISTVGSGCCFTPFPMTVSINAATLAAGTYTGEINLVQFANPGTSMTVPVTLNVVATGMAFFDNLFGRTSFSFEPSQTNPPTQSVVVGNGGTGTLSWTASASTADAGKWLSVIPATGTNTGTVHVSVTTSNLPGKGLIPGTYVGQEVLKAPSGNVTIPVSVTVGDPVFTQVPNVTFNTTVGVNPAPKTTSIASTSGSLRFTPTAYTSKGGKWLSISPSGTGCCFTPQTLTLSVNASSLAAGTYMGEIHVVQFANPATSMTVPVVLNVSSAAGSALADPDADEK